MEMDEKSGLPFAIIEGRIRPFIETLVPENLDRLKGHADNLKRCHESKDWTGLHKEQQLAHRTVQQLQSHLSNLKQFRRQVREEDVDAFERMVRPVQDRVPKAVEEFGLHQEHYTRGTDRSDGVDWEGEVGFSSLTLDDQVALVPPSAGETVQSWEDLLADLRELQSLSAELHCVLSSQQERVDRAEQCLEGASRNMEQGRIQLEKASYLKSAMLPIAGALVGGAVGLAVGGPIGLAIGSKFAFVAVATGGMVAGTSAGVAAKMQRTRNSKKED